MNKRKKAKPPPPRLPSLSLSQLREVHDFLFEAKEQYTNGAATSLAMYQSLKSDSTKKQYHYYRYGGASISYLIDSVEREMERLAARMEAKENAAG